MSLKEYLTQFVSENPEFLPARIQVDRAPCRLRSRPPVRNGAADLDKIKPGMSAEEAGEDPAGDRDGLLADAAAECRAQ